MRPPMHKARLVGLALLTSTLTLYPVHADEEPDPWFTQQKEGKTEDVSDSPSAVRISTKRPKALFKQLVSDYQKTPDGNLSKRIALLEEALSVLPDNAQEQQELAALKETRASLDKALTQASSSADLVASLETLSPYARFFRGDSTLLFQLLDSSFAESLHIKARSYSRNSDFQALETLQNAIRKAGLADILGTKITASANTSLARQIAKRWESDSQQFTALPSERYLVTALLGLPDARIPLSIKYPQNVDPKLSRNIQRSIEREWNTRFEIIDKNTIGALKPDFTLEIDATPIATDISQDSQTKESTIPGHIVEEPNPDFMDLTKRYEKAAKAYEIALISYEANYQRYLEQFERGAYEDAQDERDRTFAVLQQTPQTDAFGNQTEEYTAAKAESDAATSLANSMSQSDIPEPPKPLPRHHEILEELYLTPSTIIVSEESTPYEYTATDLDYQFSARANLALKTAVDSRPGNQEVVTLSQQRNWTQNTGVDAKDPAVDDGTFSDQDLSSALDIFSLEFGSRCSEKVSSLIQQSLNRLEHTNPQQDGIAQALAYIALKSAQSPAPIQPLGQDELAQLAELAKSDISARDFRIACLKLVLAKTEFANVANDATLATLL